MDVRDSLTRIAALVPLLLGVTAAVDASPSSDLMNDDRGGHYWFRYCDGRPDDTALPPDPRSLVTPTYDKAVVFNVSWHACLDRQPATCGELRALASGGRPAARRQRRSAKRGGSSAAHAAVEPLVDPGEPVQQPVAALGAASRVRPISTSSSPSATARRSARDRNPYPLPGEDPNLTERRLRSAPDGVHADPQRRRHAGAATSASRARSATAARSARPRTGRVSGRSTATTGSRTSICC